MKLVTFEVGTPLGPVRRIGAIVEPELTDASTIVDLNSGYRLLLREGGEPRWREIGDASLPEDMLGFLDGGAPAMQRAREVLAFAPSAQTRADDPQVTFPRRDVRLLAPVPRPRSLRDCSVYQDHMSVRNGSLERPPHWFHFPSAYKGNPAAVAGPEDPLFWPDWTERMDPELELACVIGREGRNLTVDEAADYIAGYTIFADHSARDIQSREWLGPYKGKDFGNNFGPCLVTPDEFDEMNAACALRVNGETWWEGNSGHMRQFTHPQLVAYASDEETLYPGDIIAAGTVGTSCSMDTGRWIQPGDVIDLVIEGIGTMTLTARREPREHSYVREGLPGQLEMPESARDYPQQFRQDIA